VTKFPKDEKLVWNKYASANCAGRDLGYAPLGVNGDHSSVQLLNRARGVIVHSPGASLMVGFLLGGAAGWLISRVK
jgi:lipid-binding SYLF domain-containing protein